MITAAPISRPTVLIDAATHFPNFRAFDRSVSGRVSSSAIADSAVDGCYDCPLMAVCAAYALAAREPVGVWGGLTPADRMPAARQVAS